MTENTEIIAKSQNSSKIFNVSLRGWITFMVVGTVCVMSANNIDVKEPMYTLVGMIVGYYFAQNKNANDGHRL